MVPKPIVRQPREFTEEGLHDPSGHGTIIARILKTVAPNTSFINAKVVDRTGEADEIDIMRAIEWCASSGADVMNLSLGIPRKCDGSCPLCELVSIASERAINVGAVEHTNGGFRWICRLGYVYCT